MTQATTMVVSAIIDNQMRHVYTAEERAELVGVVVDQPHLEFSSKLYVWDRPCREETDEYPSAQLRVATAPDAGYGALNWASWGEVDGGVFDSFTETPPADPVSIRFDTQSDYYFPADALLPLRKIREALAEFFTTGRKPSCVAWQDGRYY
ncbi:Imm1 family immunity protein [Saccharopolyspora sp. 5N102]|uniref:Imm1 family immunity protein n=1 Tax=Saccharopolyspora sp. 5N102 TaxID=3375155 RepID=UPI00379CB311